MGGNAIKTVEVSRFDVNTYSKTKEVLYRELNGVGVEIGFLLEVPGKTDFGDLDVLYRPNPTKPIVDIIKEKFNPVEYHINGEVLSFAYSFYDKYYQIDMIAADNFECYSFYLSYGDFGNIIGKMLKHYGLHLGTQGLFVKPIIGGAAKQIILTTDPAKICEFLEACYHDWFAFKSAEEIFDWLISIKYFNSAIFFENLKYNDKIKVDRKFYQQFLEYIKDRDIVSSITPEDLTEKMIDQFGKREVLNQHIMEHELDKTRRNKFNAKKFTKYGYENKELGITMLVFKRYITTGLSVDFNAWLDRNDNNMIEKYIERYVRSVASYRIGGIL